MILPFYDNIKYQEFRKFIGNQDLLRTVKFYSKYNELPCFQFMAVNSKPDSTYYIVYIDDLGNEIERVQLSNDEIYSIYHLGQYLHTCSGGVFDELYHTYCHYYIEILDASNGYLYSEVLTLINETKTEGLLQLNTGAFYQLNTGGFILLNDSVEGVKIDNLTKITLSCTKNYSYFNLSGLSFEFYINERPYLEQSFEQSESEENAGVETIFQKVIISKYSIEFFALGSIAENLMELSFFDDVKVETPEGKIFDVVNRLEVSREERVDASGVYRIKIEFQTEYKIDLQIASSLEISDDDMIELMVGVVQYTPSQLTEENFLASMNTIIANTGFRAVACDGANYDPDSHPYAKAILGTKDISGVARVFVPDVKGRIMIGAGTSEEDKNGDSKIIVSASNVTDGEYNHTLTQDEMTHIHVIGGAKDLNRASFFNNRHNGYLNLSSMNEYDSILQQFYEIEWKETNVFSDNVVNNNKFMTTKNDGFGNNAEHNNMQPAMGAYAWMIIDNPS